VQPAGSAQGYEAAAFAGIFVQQKGNFRARLAARQGLSRRLVVISPASTMARSGGFLVAREQTKDNWHLAISCPTNNKHKPITHRCTRSTIF
jgi:hypothetical protein